MPLQLPLIPGLFLGRAPLSVPQGPAIWHWMLGTRTHTIDAERVHLCACGDHPPVAHKALLRSGLQSPSGLTSHLGFPVLGSHSPSPGATAYAALSLMMPLFLTQQQTHLSDFSSGLPSCPLCPSGVIFFCHAFPWDNTPL